LFPGGVSLSELPALAPVEHARASETGAFFALARLIPSAHRCRISLRSRRGGRFQGEPIGWMK
jgi:hypothetical protein